MEDADLRSCSLRRDDLTGVGLRGARANAFTEWPDGFGWRQAGVVMDEEPASKRWHARTGLAVRA